MEAIIRRPTKSTPYVHLDKGTGTYLVSGRSIPIDAELFYRPILNWLDKLAEEPPRTVEFCFQFDFFNIASSKRILFILYKLVELRSRGCDVKVRWKYEKNDDDSLEIGHDYKLMVDALDFVFEEYSPESSRSEGMLKFG
jgi:hypothetical protein